MFLFSGRHQVVRKNIIFGFKKPKSDRLLAPGKHGGELSSAADCLKTARVTNRPQWHSYTHFFELWIFYDHFTELWSR